MNKTLLTIAAVLSFLSAAGYVLFSLVLIGINSFRDEIIASGGSPAEITELLQVIDALNRITFIIIVLLVLNIVAGVRLLAAKNGKATKNEVIGWSIYLFVSGGFVTGLLAVLGATSKEPQAVGTYVDQNGAVGTLEKRLKELDELYQKGVITKEEYQERRAKIIDNV